MVLACFTFYHQACIRWHALEEDNKELLRTTPPEVAAVPTVLNRQPASRAWDSYKTDAEKKAALERVLKQVEHLGTLMAEKGKKTRTSLFNRNYVKESHCDLIQFGTGYGKHTICNHPPQSNSGCNFVSFGIAKDYSFDTQIANDWRCAGFASDPTVIHPSKIHDRVTFHNFGASSMRDGQYDWVSLSLPTVVHHMLKLDHVDVVKMDCEGCEYGLARDVVTEAPDLFKRIHQFSFEIHVNKHFVETDEELYYLGLLFELLEEAGFELQVWTADSCGPNTEIAGCRRELLDRNFPCGFMEGIQEKYKGYSCQQVLFAREKTATELWNDEQYPIE